MLDCARGCARLPRTPLIPCARDCRVGSQVAPGSQVGTVE